MHARRGRAELGSDLAYVIAQLITQPWMTHADRINIRHVDAV